MRGGEGAVDHPLIGSGRLVVEEGRSLLRGGWQAGEVEVHASHEQVRRRLRRRIQALLDESGTDEGVDGMSFDPALHRRLEGPVLPPFGALGDPASEDVDLLRLQARLVRLRRRHHLVGVLTEDACDEVAAPRVARHDRAHAVVLRRGAFEGVETEVGLAVRLVRAVAGEAVLGEDGEDVAAEAHGLGAAREGGEQEDRGRGQPGHGRIIPPA